MAGEDDAAVDHALLCPPGEKAQREAANGLEQVEYIAELVERGVVELRESHLLQLHRLAVQGIYPCAGSFRSMPVHITNSPHTPPEQYFVRQHSVRCA
jgi:fido (protein-threonine AMPylation protein)